MEVIFGFLSDRKLIKISLFKEVSYNVDKVGRKGVSENYFLRQWTRFRGL